MANEPLPQPKGTNQFEKTLAVVLIHHIKTIGLFCVANRSSDFDVHAREMLESAAAQTASVLSARLEEDRQRRERGRLEEQSRQSQKMEAVGRLAGGIAHDFNNLMIVVTGYAELLRDSVENDPMALANLEEVYKAGIRAADLTRQLLAFSRKQVMKPEVFNPNRVIEDIEKMLHRLLGEDINIIVKAQSNLGCVRVDKGQLEQVFVNLAVNARDAMPEGGNLTLETINVRLESDYVENQFPISPGDYVVIAVSDTPFGPLFWRC